LNNIKKDKYKNIINGSYKRDDIFIPKSKIVRKFIKIKIVVLNFHWCKKENNLSFIAKKIDLYEREYYFYTNISRCCYIIRLSINYVTAPLFYYC